ncbi:hypothetical protein HRI_004763200 [Hibiscus trionum]|uniref:Transmembrane protein n=1 Tax=Hibiscus trionum TaxID=183268 RepID=A0A9W7JAD9_HIBTR|nr:hypothetical protein HRI_004763200 [Hibiscus trionum]
MGHHAKTILLLLLFLCLDPLICEVEGLDSSGATSASSAVYEVRKLKLEVVTVNDYAPTMPNPKHDPPPSRKSGTSIGSGGG